MWWKKFHCQFEIWKIMFQNKVHFHVNKCQSRFNWGIANMFSLFQFQVSVLYSRKQFCSNVCRCMRWITCPLPLCCLLHRVQHHRNFYFIQYVLYKMWRCMFCMNLTKGKSNKFPNSWSRINRHTLPNVYWAVNLPFVCWTKVLYFI